VRSTPELPDDPALPGLVAIRARGLAAVLPALGLDGYSSDVLLRGYTPGSCATLEVQAGPRRLAVKAYAADPALEAGLYEALGSAELTGGSGARVPSLLAWERDLRVLAVSWLEGPTAQELVRRGYGRRAGELAACWLRRARSLPVRLGPHLGAAVMLERVRGWVAALSAADPALGSSASALAEALSRTAPQDAAAGLVHGTLYTRHVIDLGDGPGVIDWQKFGQGRLELDAGMFLATLSRGGLMRERFAGEAAKAEEVLLAWTEDILEPRSLAWYQSAALLRLSQKRLPARPRNRDWFTRARALLGEAVRLAEVAA
jgi:hypothetical protein